MTSPAISPDGVRYLTMAGGKRVARPFHYRWLMPKLIGTEPIAWKAWTVGAGIAIMLGAWALTGHSEVGIFAAAVPGVAKISKKFPVLIDPFAMALALWSAAAFVHGFWPVGVVLSLVAGAAKESAPIFAAAYAWHPLGLVGLAAPAIRHCFKQGDDVLDDENKWVLAHPFKASVKYHKGVPPWVYVLPWGGLLAGFVGPYSWQLIVTVALAYGMVLMATDTVRLYQWAWPVVAWQAYVVFGPDWMLLLFVLTAVNPFATDGI